MKICVRDYITLDGRKNRVHPLIKFNFRKSLQLKR